MTKKMTSLLEFDFKNYVSGFIHYLSLFRAELFMFSVKISAYIFFVEQNIKDKASGYKQTVNNIHIRQLLSIKQPKRGCILSS